MLFEGGESKGYPNIKMVSIGYKIVMHEVKQRMTNFTIIIREIDNNPIYLDFRYETV